MEIERRGEKRLRGSFAVKSKPSYSSCKTQEDACECVINTHTLPSVTALQPKTWVCVMCTKPPGSLPLMRHEVDGWDALQHK